jgi:hypothetical protein
MVHEAKATGAAHDSTAAASDQPGPRPPRDAAWARSAARLAVSGAPSDAINQNVDGRRAVGPLQGFGQMWRKTYRVRLTGGLTPGEVIRVWKEEFPRFWPAGNRFYAPLAGLAPGEVALVTLAMPGGVPLSTGVLVLYADEEAFTLMTPEGHVFSGWITFSAERDGDAAVAQAQVLMRANDPLYELGLSLGGHRQEDAFWQRTLAALARRLGAPGGPVATQTICVDPRRQWSQARNIWHNAALRTTLYTLTHPFRGVRRAGR